MPQRWLKTLAAVTVSAVLLTACQKNDYSKDEPLPETFTPSLYIGSQNRYLYAFEPGTGVKKWEFNMHANLQATPVVVGEYLIVPTEDTLFKMDAKRGAVLKAYEFFPPATHLTSFISSPAFQGSVIYAATTTGTVYAIDTKDDKLLWTYNAGGNITSSITIYDGQLIFSGAGKVHSVAAINGVATWTTALPVDFSSPAVAAPYVYVGANDGKLYALDITTGTSKWTYATGAPIQSSPMVYGGNIIFGSNDYNVYCVDSVAKKERWIYKTADRVISSPYGSDQVVYFGSYDYYFYAVNVIDGSLKWRFKTGALVKSSPLVKDGMVYVGGFDKQLYAFDTTGALKWQKSIDGIIETSPVIYDLEKGYYPTISGMSVR